MLIKITRGTYGHREGFKIIPKTPESEPFEVTAEQAKRLINIEVAVAVDKAADKSEGTVYNMKMNLAKLTEIAQSVGIDVPEGATKKQIVEMLDTILDEQLPEDDGEDDNGEDDDGKEDDGEDDNGEAPPILKPAPPVQ